MAQRVLAINPGSTSTKISVYEDGRELFTENIRHATDELAPYAKMVDQYDFREKAVEQALEKAGISVDSINAVVGRGGLLKPIPSGIYRVNQEMMTTVREARYGEHASNLGCLIAHSVAQKAGCGAFIADPVVVDEMNPLARYSGLPEISRRSIFHALNSKAVGRRVAREMGKQYEQMNLIIVHLGGGITVGIHENGRAVDVNNALNGDGPFAPERSGGLPTGDLVNLCFSGKYTQDEVMKLLAGKGGCVSYLGTNDGREMERRVSEGDEKAKLVIEAMAYQVSKAIGEMSTVVKGKVDAIILTGSFAYFRQFTDWITERVSWIAPVKLSPGEGEMIALAEAGFRALRGEEQAREYE